MATTTKSTTQSKAHEKVDSAAEAAHKGVDSAAQMKEQSQERIEEVAHQISEQAHKIADTAKSQSEKVSTAVGEYAKEHPVKTIGIAFLAGALAASLLSKRK
ncbi:MAG: DUF883 family protein [Marinomonas foliarum]|jgi:ElaB/YqjD/DUF883 family membrane-anchored ribosome-binding protein|uniref:DUF883 family protein n=1 Tax=Marinomonas foliarum TaxID=491950 RepID=A0A369AHB2_9GAMM|nr:DUF883 family protein [Marinomonas foliarum]QRV23291.1 DUF883 family protein [Marinomonas foliarum]RCX08739.1 ElaB/YqjD/DUF883 family membrane-anchored ribosome-binding protein [Marinomonas foliarum]